MNGQQFFKLKYRRRRTRELKESAVWWIRYSSRGRQYRESSHSTNLADARRLLRHRLGQIGTGRFLGPNTERTTFDELAQMLLDDYRANGKRSLDRIEDAINHLRGSFAGLRALEVTADRITAYTAARKEEKASNGTIN